MAQRIIGLDIGTWSIKAMVLESSLRKSSAVEFREHHVPRDTAGHGMAGELRASVRATMRDLEHDGIVAAFPGTKVLLREVTLPFTDDKRIASVLRFQLESVIPKPIEDVVYDYLVLDKPTEDGGGTLLCAAVERTDLAAQLEMLKASEADPRVLTITALSTANVAPHIGVDSKERSVALIDLGHMTTSITVVRNGRVEAVRTLSRGGHQLTLALMTGLEVDYGFAEHVKHTGVRFDGYLPDDVPEEEHATRARLVARALEPLLRELKVTLHALAERTGHPIEDVVIFGGTARLPGIGGLIERVLDVPVREPDTTTGDLWQGLPPNSDARASGVTAAGLALQHVADAATHQVNFRNGEFAYESDFRAVRERATMIAVFAIVLLALFFGRKIVEINTLEGQQEQLTAALSEFTEERFPDTEFAIDPEAPVGGFTAVQRVVENPPSAAGGAIYPAMTAFKVFYDVTEIQQNFNLDAAEAGDPAAGDTGAGETSRSDDLRGQVEMQSVTSDLAEATVFGVAYDVVTVEQFRKALSVHPCFKSVTQVKGTPDVSYGDRQGWKEFTLQVEIACARPTDEADVADAAAKKDAPARPAADKEDE